MSSNTLYVQDLEMQNKKLIAERKRLREQLEERTKLLEEALRLGGKAGVALEDGLDVSKTHRTALLRAAETLQLIAEKGRGVKTLKSARKTAAEGLIHLLGTIPSVALMMEKE